MNLGTVETIYAVAMPVFALTMFIEWRMAKDHDSDRYDVKDAAASITMGVGYLLLQLLMKALPIGAFMWLYEHRLFDIEVGVLSWVLLLFAEDFCYYWYHRLHHTVRILWASHVNHHSSKFYNLSTALRQSWTAPVTGPFFWAILPLLGFPVEMVLVQQVGVAGDEAVCGGSLAAGGEATQLRRAAAARGGLEADSRASP